MRRRAQGVTIIEVLVSMVVFSIGVVIISTLFSGIRVNSSNMRTLTASQAVQDGLERTAKSLQSATVFGTLTSADAPADLDGYTWAVDVCVASTTSNSCTSAATLTKASYSYSATASILRVKMTYTPATVGLGSPVSAALEIAKP